MKIYKYTIFTLMLFLVCITNTYAACTQEEINEFKRIEDEYTIKYEFNKETKDYTVTFYFPENSKFGYLVVGEEFKAENLTTNEKNYFSYSKMKSGEYTVLINGFTEQCNETLKTIKINLPKYNKYSEETICEGIEEFVLCQPTYDKEIDYETFVSRVNTYKKSKEKEVIEEPIIEEKTNPVLEYIDTNLIQIIIICVFIILVIITAIVTIKSIRKSRRLD